MSIDHLEQPKFGEPSVYVTTAELCRRYKLSRGGVRSWIRGRPNGFPLPVKLGRKLSWLREELLAWEQAAHDRKAVAYVQPDWAKPKEANYGAK